MFRTSLIVMSAILAMAFCLPGAAEARGDHNWKKHRYDGKKHRDDDDNRRKHRYGGRPFRALLNHINELEAKMEALSLEMSSTSSTPVSPATSGPQVSFLATVLNDFSIMLGAKKEVIFDLVVHDDGSNYDPGIGAYVAPVSGVYQFDATVIYDSTATSSATALLQLLLNGQGRFDLDRERVIISSETLDAVSGSLKLRLNQGDTVQIVYVGPAIRRASFTNSLGGTRFSGHQLYSSEGP